jgi:hypothetical protein
MRSSISKEKPNPGGLAFPFFLVPKSKTPLFFLEEEKFETERADIGRKL